MALKFSEFATLLAQLDHFELDHFELCKEFGRKVVEATAFESEYWNFFVLAFGIAALKRMETDPLRAKSGDYSEPAE